MQISYDWRAQKHLGLVSEVVHHDGGDAVKDVRLLNFRKLFKIGPVDLVHPELEQLELGVVAVFVGTH